MVSTWLHHGCRALSTSFRPKGAFTRNEIQPSPIFRPLLFGDGLNNGQNLSVTHCPKYSQFHAVFLGNLAKRYVGAPPATLGLAPPPTGNPGSAPELCSVWSVRVCGFGKGSVSHDVRISHKYMVFLFISPSLLPDVNKMYSSSRLRSNLEAVCRFKTQSSSGSRKSLVMAKSLINAPGLSTEGNKPIPCNRFMDHTGRVWSMNQLLRVV